MNKQEAQALVEADLEESKDPYNPIDCVILEEETIEKKWGWVFFYQNKEYLKTNDFRDMLCGNAPAIVNRNTGKLSYTDTAHSIEHYIKEYEASL